MVAIEDKDRVLKNAEEIYNYTKDKKPEDYNKLGKHNFVTFTNVDIFIKDMEQLANEGKGDPYKLFTSNENEAEQFKQNIKSIHKQLAVNIVKTAIQGTLHSDGLSEGEILQAHELKSSLYFINELKLTSDDIKHSNFNNLEEATTFLKNEMQRLKIQELSRDFSWFLSSSPTIFTAKEVDRLIYDAQEYGVELKHLDPEKKTNI